LNLNATKLKYHNNNFNKVIFFAQKTALKEMEIGKKLIPEVNIGMVGHVDHGKTSLTAALTGKWTDTHSEEIRRGITIRLGYADSTFYLCDKCKGHEDPLRDGTGRLEPMEQGRHALVGTPLARKETYGNSKKCEICGSECRPLRTVSFVDAPGHETLMATVLSGAALMDGALLIISANEPCPQPQTREHLTALEITGIKNIVVVQTKIDLVTEEQALENYKQIRNFLKGTIYGNAPVIPVSAQQKINLSALVEAIQNHIQTPGRDLKKDPFMLVARSFDVNKPGTPIESLQGGVIGGSLIQGTLNAGSEIEIRPGVGIKDRFYPIKTKITGLKQSNFNLDIAEPGGLLGISTTLDPSLSKSDSLSGNVIGLPGKLPNVLYDLTMKIKFFERVVGAREELKMEPVKANDVLMLTILTTRVVGVITSIKGGKADIKLKSPVCAEKGSRAAISRQIAGRWRLVGWGEIV